MIRKKQFEQLVPFDGEKVHRSRSIYRQRQEPDRKRALSSMNCESNDQLYNFLGNLIE